MHAQDIEHNLSLLGEQLEELGVQTLFRLLMIGGGFMLTQVGNRTFTDDVDVLVWDRDILYDTDDYRIFRNAARFVAYDEHISESWLSDNISDFLENAGPVPRGRLWRKFGRYLSVYIPPKEYIFAHKLVAGREKDLRDIEALKGELKITTRKKAQRIVDKYIVNRDIQQHSNLRRMLDRYFPV